MKKYQNLLTYDENEIIKVPKTVKKTTALKVVGAKTPKIGNRGCENCPLDKVPGVNKVKNLDKIIGKKIMVWAQNPGEQENRERRELIGPAGKFLWKEAARVGLYRQDCDVQNIVRCWTVDVNELSQLEVREPSKEEIHCCSIYSEEAVAKSKAKVHLILGKVAAKALLKGEFRKDQKTFFSEKLQAWCVLASHPAYFLRGAPRSARKEFQDALASVVQKAGMKEVGKFAYIEQQDYKEVEAAGLTTELYVPLVAAAEAGELISVDIEDGWDGKRNVLICIGFSWKKGLARVVFLEHPEVDPKGLSKKLEVIEAILGNPNIKKAFQHGTYDVKKIKELLGFKTVGYVHDTNYSEYLRFSGRRSFSLETTADVRFKEFAGYKTILDSFKAKDSNMADFLRVPKRVLTIYNGADCDLQYRIAKSNHSKVDASLLHVFILAAFPLAAMEEAGPWFDFDHDEILKEWLPIRIDYLTRNLKQIAGNKDFNPNAPAQVAHVVYDRLKLGKHLDASWLNNRKRQKSKSPGRSTDKETMELLGKHHIFPKLQQEYRVLAKKKGTYLDGYRKSAELHKGRVTTAWWLTGTITGRLRSGGSRDKSRGIVNLQNIHGDPVIECLLISDTHWREVYQAWLNSSEANL